jgi:hypothetical protein
VPRALFFLLVSKSELSESANDSPPHVMINRDADRGNAINWAPGGSFFNHPRGPARERSPPGYGNAATRPGHCGQVSAAG